MRRLLVASAYVGENSPTDFVITTDVAPPGLSNGDIVTWNPTGTQHPLGAVPGRTFGVDAFTSVNDGVAAADPGATVYVEAGLYAGDVNINKSVILSGAQLGVDPNDAAWNDTRLNPLAEATIHGAVNLSLRNNIVINGFTVERTALNEGHILIGSGNPTGTGSSSSFDIRNNRFVGTRTGGTAWAGIHTNFLNDATQPGAQFVAHQNRIEISGTGSGSGILINANLPGTDGMGSTTITDTYVANSPGNGFNVNRPGASALISGNRAVNDDIFTFRANNAVISNNTVIDAPQAAISNTGGSTNWTATNNTITRPRAQAFLVGSTFTVDPVTDITISGNTVTVDPTLVGVGITTVFTPLQFAYFDIRGNMTGTNAVNNNTLSLGGTPLNPAVVAVYGLRVRGNVGNLSVTNNDFDGNGVGGAGDATLPPSSGVFVDTDTLASSLDLSVAENLINGWVNGASVYDTDLVAGSFGGLPSGASFVLFNNDLSGNSGFGVQSGAAGAITNASGNWWGVNTASGVAAEVAGNVDYTPWLHLGTDTSANAGFQGDFSHLHVDDNSSQAGAVGRINEAVNLLADGSLAGGNRIINVEAGTYSESAAVNKPVMLLGAQAGVDARGRVANESVITSPGANETFALVNITADNVKMDGFTVDGNNTSIPVGVVLLDGSTDSNAARGVVVDGDGVQVLNNRVRNLYRRGVQFGFNDAPTGGSVSQNEFDLIGADDTAGGANSGFAMLAFSDPDFTDNDVTNAHNGAYYIQVYPPSSAAITVSGNDIATRETGITLNETSSSIPAITITNNTVTTTAAGGIGAVLWSVGGGLNFTNNTFTTTAADTTGIHAWVGTASVPMNVTVASSSISGYARGLHVTNEANVNGTPTPANDAATVNLSGVTITPATGGTGVLVEDTAAGTTMVTAGLSGVTINGSASGTGVRLSGSQAKLAGDTLGDTAFAGFTGTSQFVVLADGAYNAGPEINGMNATYNGVAAGPALSLADGFAIEDRITHRVDVPGVGFVRTKPGHVFVTQNSFSAPATTTPSIQRGVDSAAEGDTVNLQAGTYAESVTIPKSVTIDGEGEGATPLVTWTSDSSNPLATITTTDATDDVTFLDIAFDATNGANTAGDGIRAHAPAANFDTLTVDRSTFTDFSFDAISVNGDTTNGVSARNVVISNSSFTNNGTGGGGGAGDISLFTYNGDASFNNLTLVGTATATTGARLGIQLRGVGAANGAGVMPMGTVAFNNVDVSGKYRTQMIGLQRYANVDDLTLNNVKLGGATSEITGTFGASLRLDAIGNGTLASPATIDLGNTMFRGLAPASAQRHEIEIAPDNAHTFLHADGTDTTWRIAGVDVTASTLTLPQAFQVEDRILHYVDKLNPTHGTYKGFVEIQPGKAFITDEPEAGALGEGSIQRGSEVVPVGGTVHVEAGTYNQLATINKTVNILGAQAGVDARTRTGQPESILANAGGSLSLNANNIVVDGFTIRDANAAPLGTGVFLNSANSGYQILNNIFTNNTFGLYLNSQGTNQTVVRHNLFDSNNQPGAASGNGIYTDLGSRNVLVDENRFTGHTSAAMVFAGGPGTQSDITVSDNQMVNDNSIVFFNTTNVDILNNVSTGSMGSVIFLGGGNSDVLISGNNASAAPTRTGVSLPNPSTFGMTANSNVRVIGNSFTGLLNGIRASTGSTSDAVLIQGNTLNANTNGVRVDGGNVSITDDNDIAVNAGAGVLVETGGTALIDGNDSTGIHDNFIGIDVAGGTATISNNDILDNTTGIRVTNNGTATITSNQFSGNGLGLNVVSGNAEVTNTQRIDGVEIGNSGTVTLTENNDVVLVTTSLLTFGSGRLDLRDNAAIIDYTGASPLPSIFTRLQTGYAGGAWNGPGIMSQTAANDPNMRTAVGYAEATDLFNSFPATFEGQAIDNTSILLKYTLYGDATLDGLVNLDDFNRLAANFGQSPRRWSQGDFTFDQNVNLDDFNRLAANFGMTLADGGLTVESGDDEVLPPIEAPTPVKPVATGGRGTAGKVG